MLTVRCQRQRASSKTERILSSPDQVSGNRPMLHRSCILFCIVFLASCRSSEWIPHPRSDQLVTGDPPTVISPERGAPLPRAAEMLVAELTAVTAGETLGLFEGSAALEFGSIRGIERDAAGRFVILDDQASELRVFVEVEGTFEVDAVLGGAGNGPGELQAPRGLGTGSDGALLVFNRVGQVDLFSSDGDGLTWKGRRRFPGAIEDACAVGDTLILSAVARENHHTVHVVDQDEQRIRSFAQLYRTENERLRRHIQRAQLECVDTHGGVLLAPLLLPELRRFSTSGELLWRTRLDGLKSVYLAVNSSDGNVAVGTPEDGYHMTVGLHLEKSSGLIVWQVLFRERGARERGEDGTLLTYVVLLDSGEGALVADDIPQIQFLDETAIVFSRRNPFPTARIVRRVAGQEGP